MTPTNTYILNFNTPKPPTEIKIGYMIEKVEVYIPNPLRCHNCQKLGTTRKDVPDHQHVKIVEKSGITLTANSH